MTNRQPTQQAKHDLLELLRHITDGPGLRALVVVYEDGGVTLAATDYKSADAAIAFCLEALADVGRQSTAVHAYEHADALCRRFPIGGKEFREETSGDVSGRCLAYGYVRPSPIGPAPFECGGGWWPEPEVLHPFETIEGWPDRVQ